MFPHSSTGDIGAKDRDGLEATINRGLDWICLGAGVRLNPIPQMDEVNSEGEEQTESRYGCRRTCSESLRDS